jgi:pimeloyl-ACP methyl ester carboxylesterase
VRQARSNPRAAQKIASTRRGKKGKIALERNKAPFVASKRPQSCVGLTRPQRKVNPNAKRYVPCRPERSLSEGDQGFGFARHSLRIECAVLTSFSHCSKLAKLATPSLPSILWLSNSVVRPRLPTIIKVVSSPSLLGQQSPSCTPWIVPPKMTTGQFHTYWPERYLKVFEHLPSYGSESPGPTQDKPNTLLFVGGLFGGFDLVPYVARLANRLTSQSANTWSVMEIQLTSFGVGYGACDLNRDVEEIARGVEWLRSRPQKTSSKIVLMGHSTGSQDVLHYLYHGTRKRPVIDGAILQAPVSDREMLNMTVNDPEGNDDDQHSVREAYEECIQQARQLQIDPDGPSLPRSLTSKLGFMHAFLSASRFLSLASPNSPDQPSMDDLFSSDIPDHFLSSTFGMVGKRGRLNKVTGGSFPVLMVLISGADEHVPSSIDKEALLARWKTALENGGATLAPSSGVLAGAKHNGESVGEERTDLVDRCFAYLKVVEGKSG